MEGGHQPLSTCRALGGLRLLQSNSCGWPPSASKADGEAEGVFVACARGPAGAGRKQAARGLAPPAQLLGEVVLAADDVDISEHEPAALEVVGELGNVGHLGDALQVVARLGRLLEHQVALREADECGDVLPLGVEQLQQHRRRLLEVGLGLVAHEGVALEHLLTRRRRQLAQQSFRGQHRLARLGRLIEHELVPVGFILGIEVDLDHVADCGRPPFGVAPRQVELFERSARVVQEAL
eukprot:scaffold11423_cov123-Isochrysis_galbana.AAC.8